MESECFYLWSVWLTGIALAVNIATLFFIIIYVNKTKKIAEASVKHNDIIYRAVITISIDDTPINTEDTGLKPFEVIETRVTNHSKIHGNARVLIEYCVRSLTGDGPLAVLISGKSKGFFDGKKIWNLPAESSISLTHVLPELVPLVKEEASDGIFLKVSAEERNYGVEGNEFRVVPPTYYLWNTMSQKWQPHPSLIAEAVFQSSMKK